MSILALFLIAFVGTHFLMSHPLRAVMVGRLGENGFRGVYSLVSLVTFAGSMWTYRGLGDQMPLWTAGEAVWVAAALLMWFASILFIGSFAGNPALPGAP